HLPLSMTPPSLGDASHSLSITYSDFRRPSVFRQQSCVLEARGSPLLFASGSGRAALGSLGAETATGTGATAMRNGRPRSPRRPGGGATGAGGVVALLGSLVAVVVAACSRTPP